MADQGIFRVGDRVEAIDDIFSGVVREVKKGLVTVESSDGFLLEYSPGQLMLSPDPGQIRVSNREAAEASSDKERAKPKRHRPVKRKERQAPKMEVDLHIHQLVPSTRGMNKYDILNLQLEAARKQLEFAIEKRIQKVVFIHGVGEGIQKEELKYLFNRYENLRFYDADYQKYGLGATEVFIFQNP